VVDQFFNWIVTKKPGQILWMCILCSEIMTLLANTLQSLIWWGTIDTDLLMIGAIDALVVSLIVAVLFIRIFKKFFQLEFEKDFLETEIVERKRAEENLKQSEEKYRLLINNATEGIAVSQDWRFKFVNPRMSEITGYFQEELMARPVMELIHPDDRETVLKKYGSRLAGKPMDSEFSFKSLDKTGQVRWIEMHTVAFNWEGKPAFLHFFQDISDRRKSDEEIKRNAELQTVINALLSLSIEAVPLETILEMALDRILSLSWLTLESKGAILLAEKDPDVLHLKAFRGIPPSLQKACDRVPFGQCICGNAAKKREIEFADRITERHDISCEGMTPHGHYCVPILFSERVLGVINLYVSEGHRRLPEEDAFLKVIAHTLAGIIIRKQTEEALQEREERFRTLFNQAADCILIMDPTPQEGPVILEANLAAHTMHGYAPGELIGKPISILDSPEGKKKIPERAAVLMSGEHLNEEAEHVRKDGTVFPIEISARLIRINGKPYIQAIDRDITERKRAEEEKVRLETQLLQSQKMEAIGTLAGGVAHDFNNLLTAIIGYSNLLQMDLEDDSPLKLYVEQVLAASEKAAGLTQSLLAFSRKQVMELRPQSLHLMLQGTEKILKRLLTEDIEFQVILNDSLLTVMADAIQIDQVLMNLASNARDSMPKGGKLIIETKAVYLDQDFIRLHEYGEPGPYALISVTDTGLGMDEKTRKKIFDPFFTTKGVGKGTGLGLSIVYGIIKQHSGYIQVESEPGKGSVFKIFLPMVEIPAEKERKTQEELVGGTETILVTEDSQEVRRFIKEILTKKGYTVIEAVDGEQAVQKFLKEQDRIDLLLLDVVMPKKNGVLS
jgi:PAS domain S-box-containing protein